MSRSDARDLADSLLFAELRGVHTHGLLRLDVYLRRIEAGGIDPRAKPVVDTDLGALCVVDCAAGPGACGACFVARLAADRAGSHGVAAVIGRNANHFGAAGYYASLLADRGLVAIVASNGDPIMCVPDGGRPVVGTHPLAIAVPAGADGSRPLLDMATSEASYGKLLVASRAGSEIPPTWAVDADGEPTVDPEAALRGALLPAAGAKGFGLAFMIDLLVGLGGSAPSPEVGPLYGADEQPQRLGLIVIAISVAALPAAATYADRVERLIAAVRASRDQGHPLGQPLIPGEPENRAATAAGNTIDLDESLLATLVQISERTGVPLP